MLRNVLVDYIETLTERQFDIPLLCILLKNGFYDIHFTHGSFEFGKDFIAKKREGDKVVQYFFQSKGGNIGLPDWGQIRWQIDEARINPLSHPSFDDTLDRKVVLVLTGRLVGGAGISTQKYKEYCKNEGKIGFNVWDIDNLIEMILSGEVNSIGLIKEQPELLSIIAKIQTDNVTFKDLERYSRNWMERCKENNKKSFLGVILEASIFATELENKGRLTLACYVSLFPTRAIVHSLHSLGNVPMWAKPCLQLVRKQFDYYSNHLLFSLKENFEDNESVFYNQVKGAHTFITYPVICSQIMEIIGLIGLLKFDEDNKNEAEEIVNILEILIRKNTGFFSPLSDKYAISLLPPLILFAKFNRLEMCELIIKKNAIWLCNRYEISEFGMASPYATEDEEVQTLLGYSYDFMDLTSRRESYLATLLLDMSALLGLSELYEDILNDILATSIYPCNVETNNSTQNYMLNGDDIVYTPNVRFEEVLIPNGGWRNAVNVENNPTFCSENGLWWELLGIATTMRDRHYISDLRILINDM
ncbi:hypothetical protein [Oceanobacillus sp. FSL W7-1293]|uniref:hypothetical protein n=1 Tax=Oceanobacillus sp. FSL W7-1293 TaxID=2921699 RepID=UPI0030CACD12